MGLFSKDSSKKKGNKPRLTWEDLESFPAAKRAKVPGGWLVSTAVMNGDGVCFMPDPEHKWDGGSL